MPRTSRPITVTLGDLHERVVARVKSGAYASASEVLRAALRALDREESALADRLRAPSEPSPAAEPPPNLLAREVFKRLRDHHAQQAKAGGKEKG
jgi:antitoxin ParD1/3/4